MTPLDWAWVGAISIGAWHRDCGGDGQDSAACREFATPAGPVLVAIVSDGAGSASHARLGARIACRRTLSCFAAHFASGGDLAGLDEATVRGWLDAARSDIAATAERAGRAPRDFAATLVVVAAGPTETLILHVGDGGAVLRVAGAPDWRVPSWPEHGEYANVTYFVTDDPTPRLRVTRVEGAVDALALFTDGLERLLLDFSDRTAYGDFFDYVFAPIEAAAVGGRDRVLSRHLHDYLDSPAICERTDDDKSLLLAFRRGSRWKKLAP